MVWFCKVTCCYNSSKASIVTIFGLFSSTDSSGTVSGFAIAWFAILEGRLIIGGLSIESVLLGQTVAKVE
ncbi:12981_t:CDS:2 [Gigaspora margarita]|uniref:12981_t:CDS:1 n=1 Tax=Gigaspora margarita TaxID=4874 RepID=A0ABM8VWS7_GIGMA|nr:12981_t:CDS:2 [Gigaspora margarita]